jgi:hypothetical protein
VRGRTIIVRGRNLFLRGMSAVLKRNGVEQKGFEEEGVRWEGRTSSKNGRGCVIPGL